MEKWCQCASDCMSVLLPARCVCVCALWLTCARLCLFSLGTALGWGQREGESGEDCRWSRLCIYSVTYKRRPSTVWTELTGLKREASTREVLKTCIIVNGDCAGCKKESDCM